MTVTFLKTTGLGCFVECPSIGILFGVFLMIRPGIWIFGRKTAEDKVLFSSRFVKGTYYQHDLLLLVLTLVPWVRWFLPGVSSVKFLSLLLPVLCSLGGRHLVQPPTRKEWGIRLSFLEGGGAAEVS